MSSGEAFDASPNYYAASADLQSPRQISDTNPFQSNYAWGKSQLIEYDAAQCASAETGIARHQAPRGGAPRHGLTAGARVARAAVARR